MATPAQNPRTIRILLGVVISLGALLLLGLLLVVMTILSRIVPEETPSAPFEHRIAIPPDMAITELRQDSRRVIVRLAPRQNRDGQRLLLWLDAKTGEELGRVVLAPRGAPR